MFKWCRSERQISVQQTLLILLKSLDDFTSNLTVHWHRKQKTMNPQIFAVLILGGSEQAAGTLIVLVFKERGAVRGGLLHSDVFKLELKRSLAS